MGRAGAHLAGPDVCVVGVYVLPWERWAIAFNLVAIVAASRRRGGGLFWPSTAALLSARSSDRHADIWIHASEASDDANQCDAKRARRSSLATQSEAGEQGVVPVDVRIAQVAELATALTDEHEEPAARVEVVPVLSQVVGERLDAIGEQRDLHLGRTSVARESRVVTDDRLLLVRCLHGYGRAICMTGAIEEDRASYIGIGIACSLLPTHHSRRPPDRSDAFVAVAAVSKCAAGTLA